MPVDIEQAIDLRTNHNLSYEKIGQIQGVSAQAVHQAIRHLPAADIINAYKNNRADILTGEQIRILNTLDDDTLKKARLGEKMMAFGILYDKERLERGQATSISAVDIRQLIASVSVDNPVDNNEPNDIV